MFINHAKSFEETLTWLSQHRSESLIGGDDGKKIHPKAHGSQLAASMKLI